MRFLIVFIFFIPSIVLSKSIDKNYTDTLLNKFYNPFLKDTDSLQKQFKLILEKNKYDPYSNAKTWLAYAQFNINHNKNFDARTCLGNAEASLLKINGAGKRDIIVQIAMLYAELGNIEKSKFWLNELRSKLRDFSNPIFSISNLLKQASVYAYLKDYKSKKETLDAVDDIVLDVNESEIFQVIAEIIINSIRLERFKNLEKYYALLLKNEHKINSNQFLLAIALYQDYKKQYLKAEQNYKKNTGIYLKGNRSEYGFEALVRLASLYSKQLKIDSAKRYFNIAGTGLNQAINKSYLGSFYKKSYQEHLQRFNQNKNLMVEISKAISQKDSMYQLQIEQVLKESKYKYSLLNNRQQIKLLKQQKQLDDLNYEKVKQQNWLIILSLFLLVLVAFTFSYIVLQKRKRSILKFKSEAMRAEHLHQLALNKMLAISQEEERSRIAEKLHDEIGSMLALVRFNLSPANHNQIKDLSPEKLQVASKVLAEVANTVREMSHQLMPVALSKLGLKQAIEQLIWDINAAGKISVESVIMGLDTPENNFNHDFEINFYRIVQELFQNILKHSEASQVVFQLLLKNDEINLIVEDNGLGISYNSKTAEGKGLELIKARLSNYKGKINIESSLGNGTAIIIEIPKFNIIT